MKFVWEETLSRKLSLVLLRMAVGWHFLYEGLVKAVNPTWSAKTYLLDSGGFLKSVFIAMAQHENMLRLVNQLNIIGLILIGLALVVGLYSVFASRAGIFLLLLYYLSHPAWPGIASLFPSDGNYFIVNKTIVEIIALVVLSAYPTDHFIGLARLFKYSIKHVENK